MNLSEQAVYLGTTRYRRTVWNTRRRRSDLALLGTVRFKGLAPQVVRYVGNEEDLQLQGTRGNCGHWVIDHTPETPAPAAGAPTECTHQGAVLYGRVCSRCGQTVPRKAGA